MKLLALYCRNCGAPLEVPKHTRYTKCTYCEAELSVEESRKEAPAARCAALQPAQAELKEDGASSPRS